METIGGLDHIFVDHFKPYRVETENRFETLHGVFVIGVPLLGGIAIGYFAGQFVAANSGAIVAIYAVMASVMTAVMPTVNSLIGPVDRERIKALREGSTTSDLNIREATALIARVEIVRGLYAAVAWSVIVLAFSLIPLLVISHSAFQPDRTISPAVDVSTTIWWFRMALATLVGFAGVSAFVALLQIVSGVHLMTRYSQVDIEGSLRELKKQYKL